MYFGSVQLLDRHVGELKEELFVEDGVVSAGFDLKDRLRNYLGLFGLIIDGDFDEGVTGGFLLEIELPNFEGFGFEVVEFIEGDDYFIGALFHEIVLG